MKNIIFFFFLLFSSCTYKDYIMLSDEYSKGVYNKDKTQISFFKFYRISKPAKGLAAFPDGGQSKILYRNIILYTFDIQSNKLRIIYTFDGLSGNHQAWKTWTYFDTENHLYFNISPSNRYKSYYVPTGNIYDKYKGLYVYDSENKDIKKISDAAETPEFSADGKKNIYTDYSSGKPQIYMMDKNGTNVKFKDNGYNLDFSPNGNYLAYIYELDSAMYDLKVMNFIDDNYLKIKTIKNINKYSIYWLNNQVLCFNDVDGKHKKFEIASKTISDNTEKRKIDKEGVISATEIGEFTKNITYPEWGIKLQKCCPKSKKEILESIVNTNKGNQKYRIALLQEIENELSINDINHLLKIIEEHKNELTDYEKSSYERNTKETVKYLEKIRSKKE